MSFAVVAIISVIFAFEIVEEQQLMTQQIEPSHFSISF